jgi:hypothetical protein
MICRTCWGRGFEVYRASEEATFFLLGEECLGSGVVSWLVKPAPT